eukprot:13100112-Ditylum_brightwellii.AAC.1
MTLTWRVYVMHIKAHSTHTRQGAKIKVLINNRIETKQHTHPRMDKEFLSWWNFYLKVTWIKFRGT